MAVTALLCSRSAFLLFDDPEGPNLLIVTVFAAIIYVLTWAVNRYCLPAKLEGIRRLFLLIGIQILIAAVFYLSLS